jgi:hypothetical protein
LEGFKSTRGESCGEDFGEYEDVRVEGSEYKDGKIAGSK